MLLSFLKNTERDINTKLGKASNKQVSFCIIVREGNLKCRSLEHLKMKKPQGLALTSDRFGTTRSSFVTNRLQIPKAPGHIFPGNIKIGGFYRLSDKII